MSNIIELKNTEFTAQGRKLLRNVSFGFEEGTATVLAGPSGSGKSTVLKIAAGLFPPDRGEAIFRGKSIARMSRAENLAFRRESAVVFQDAALWANQSLFQILELPLRVHFPAMSKLERIRRIESVAAEVGYKKALGIRPSQLSMGEQKLIAFARALICKPRLLFLDEWTESLDKGAATRLVSMVKNLKEKNGVSIILVTHEMEIIHKLADVVLMIFGGRIFVRFTKEQIENDKEMSRYIERNMS